MGSNLVAEIYEVVIVLLHNDLTKYLPKKKQAHKIKLNTQLQEESRLPCERYMSNQVIYKTTVNHDNKIMINIGTFGR